MTFLVPTAFALAVIAIPITVLYILKLRMRQVHVSSDLFWQVKHPSQAVQSWPARWPSAAPPIGSAQMKPEALDASTKAFGPPPKPVIGKPTGTTVPIDRDRLNARRLQEEADRRAAQRAGFVSLFWCVVAAALIAV